MIELFFLNLKRGKLLAAIIWLVPVFAFAQADKMPVTDTAASCGCLVINPVKPAAGNYPKLAERIDYATLNNISGWKLQGGLKEFNGLGMMNERFAGDEYDIKDELRIISLNSPICITEPNNAFTVNLTPCANQNGNYVLPVSVYSRPAAVSKYKDLDVKNFQNTTLWYLHFFMQRSGLRPDQVIRVAFKQTAHNYGMEGVNRAIANINNAYQTGIPLTTEKNYNDSLMICGVLDSLVSKKLRQENVLNTGFILTEPGVHPPTYYEQYHMQLLFEHYSYDGGFELFDTRKFFPDYNINIGIRHAVVEISTKVISPATISGKAPPLYEEMWTNVASASLVNEYGLFIGITHICLPPSVIAGTTVAIDFNKATLHADPKQGVSGGFDYDKFPQFALGEVNGADEFSPETWKRMDYDTLLMRFCGLIADSARFKIPDGKAALLVKGRDVLINNRLVAGCLALDFDSDNSGKVLITADNGKAKAVPASYIMDLLNKAGLKIMITRNDNCHLYLYFKKIAG